MPSSSSEPTKLTLVASPVQLITVKTDTSKYREALEELSKSLQCPVHLLFSEGLVKVFAAEEIPIKTKEPSVDLKIQ